MADEIRATTPTGPGREPVDPEHQEQTEGAQPATSGETATTGAGAPERSDETESE